MAQDGAFKWFAELADERLGDPPPPWLTEPTAERPPVRAADRAPLLTPGQADEVRPWMRP